MENLYNPHKDPFIIILLIAVLVSGGVGYALNSQLDKCWESNRSARGEVYTVSLGPRTEQKVTSHNGKVYMMIQAPTEPDRFIRP